jgi:anti-sigma B factor antagonist
MSMETGGSTGKLVSAVRREGTTVVVTVCGEIDLHNSPELRGELLKILGDTSVRKLILTLSEVPYMDSSAVAVLVEALQKLRRVGGKVYLAALQPRVKGLLEIARLDSIFVVTASEEEAMKK